MSSNGNEIQLVLWTSRQLGEFPTHMRPDDPDLSCHPVPEVLPALGEPARTRSLWNPCRRTTPGTTARKYGHRPRNANLGPGGPIASENPVERPREDWAWAPSGFAATRSMLPAQIKPTLTFRR